MQVIGHRQSAVFVSQSAPVFLILGLDNKLVKPLGSDYTDERS